MLSWQASSLAVVVLLHGLLLSHISCGSIGNTADILFRGVGPSLRSEYGKTDGKFRCLRSGEVISDSQVNDQYCDCRDGSDEPGRSFHTSRLVRLFKLHARRLVRFFCVMYIFLQRNHVAFCGPYPQGINISDGSTH